MVTLAFLSAHTQKIALGTAGLIAPLRSPIHIAKSAVSVDKLSNGRFLLGLSSGDRPVEYPAFGADFARRVESFRESIDLIKTLTEQAFPHFHGKHYGDLTRNLDLLPSLIVLCQSWRLGEQGRKWTGLPMCLMRGCGTV